MAHSAGSRRADLVPEVTSRGAPSQRSTPLEVDAAMSCIPGILIADDTLAELRHAERIEELGDHTAGHIHAEAAPDRHVAHLPIWLGVVETPCHAGGPQGATEAITVPEPGDRNEGITARPDRCKYDV